MFYLFKRPPFAYIANLCVSMYSYILGKYAAWKLSKGSLVTGYTF